ncbi:MarR family transcriptional regulator [Chromobacterium haemolyticum]|nr:MarR family transcriptional regulator [Chromobacterium haemolyticum]
MDTHQQLLYWLKTRGPLTAQQLAGLLGLTSMGARRQLEASEEAGLVCHEDKSVGVGRPQRWWRLRDAGHARFPDRHGDVMVQLITLMRSQLGEEGVEQLITAREAKMAVDYASELSSAPDLATKLAVLTKRRTEEGYMAELETICGGWLLIEHHCPICACAQSCQAFCRSELALFRQLLPEAHIERSEHLMDSGARCIYHIKALPEFADTDTNGSRQ